MPELVVHVLEFVAQMLEIIGAGSLIVGFVVATLHCLGHLREPDTFDRYRRALGRVVVIGLEILVAATIVKTVTVAPTPEALGLLAVMIAIRTLLSWTMGLEISGRWPWQKSPRAER